MSTVMILFGTESGNSEMVADDLGCLVTERGHTATVAGMEDATIDELADQELVLLVSSTYGEGDLPVTAIDFHAELRSARPDLSGLRFAAFGLGDSTYDTYNLGIATLVTTFEDLGATQLGQVGHHDADSGLDPGQIAVAWAAEVLDYGVRDLAVR